MDTMSLTRAQKEFIEASIGHLLEFPAEPDKLSAEVTKIKKSFSEPHNQDNDYYPLTRCLRKPAKTLRRLEKYNQQETSIGRVQEYILVLVTERIKKAAVDANMDFNRLDWNIDSISAQMIEPSAFLAAFKSSRARLDDVQLPWLNITDDGKIFTSALFLREDTPHVCLETEVELPDGVHNKCIEKFRELPAGDYDQDEFLLELIPEAKEQAYEICEEAVLDFLVSSGSTSPHTVGLVMMNPNLKQILCDDFYIKLISSGRVSLISFIRLDAHEVETLLNQTVKNLIAGRHRTFSQAMHMSKIEIQAAGCYFTMLAGKKILYEQITDLSEDQGKILLHPVIVNLVNKGALRFSTAKMLPVCLRPLLSSDLYMEYFSKGKIDWDAMRLIRQSHCDFLLHKEFARQIAALIKENIFSLTDVLTFTPEMQKRALSANILGLLLKKIISARDLHVLLPRTFILVNEHPHLNEWLQCGLITIRDVEQASFPVIYTKAYANRMLAIQRRQPCVLKGKTDTAEQISLEMAYSAVHADMELTDLRERVMRRYALELDLDISRRLKENITAEERSSLLLLKQKTARILETVLVTSMLSDLIDSYDRLLQDLLATESRGGHSQRPNLFNHNSFQTSRRAFNRLIDGANTQYAHNKR